MPKPKVETTYVKVEKKQKVGRPKGKVTKRPPKEVSDLQQFLNENEGGDKGWLELIEEFRKTCDHLIWPQELVMTEGSRKWYRCTGCRKLTERTGVL